MARIEEETARISTELQNLPDFRAGERRIDFEDVANTVYPPPPNANDEALQEHRSMLWRAISDASGAVARETRRIFSIYEQDLASWPARSSRLVSWPTPPPSAFERFGCRTICA